MYVFEKNEYHTLFLCFTCQLHTSHIPITPKSTNPSTSSLNANTEQEMSWPIVLIHITPTQSNDSHALIIEMSCIWFVNLVLLQMNSIVQWHSMNEFVHVLCCVIHNQTHALVCMDRGHIFLMKSSFFLANYAQVTMFHIVLLFLIYQWHPFFFFWIYHYHGLQSCRYNCPFLTIVMLIKFNIHTFIFIIPNNDHYSKLKTLHSHPCVPTTCILVLFNFK